MTLSRYFLMYMQNASSSFHERLNPFPFYFNMRKNNPIEYNEKSDLWNAYRYNDVKMIITNYVDFSSDFTKLLAMQYPDRTFRRSLLSSDPPLHRHLRSVISSAFSAASIERLEPRIKNITNGMIDQVIEKGSMDLVTDLSYPLPVTVIAELLGIPAEDRDTFKRWADRLLKSIDDSVETGARRNDELEQIQNEMDDYFQEIIKEKKEKPGDDLVTYLIKAETDEKRLSEEDILSFSSLLLQAGHITTVNLINNCILSLLEHPQQLKKVQNDNPSLITPAIEETLRYRSPVQALIRFATKDIEVGGKTIKSGQRIIAWIGSANHDETIFSNPEEFNVVRSPNPHIAFGAGIHLCLGAPLARLESKVAIQILLSRLQNLELGDDIRNLEPVSNSLLFYGVKGLPLSFEARQNKVC
jgi:cytochrome P450